MSSLNSSVSTETDSQNHKLIPGFNIPLLPVAPFVPQPLGVTTTTSSTTSTTSTTTSTTSTTSFPTITSGSKVNVMRTFQEMFENAKIAFDRINFYSGVIIIDRGQIKQFENMYRELDVYVNSLIPYIPSHFDSLNVQGMIHTMRNLQNKIEDKLIIFYQNLLERDQMKVVFTLPQLRDYSFVEAVNRSVHHLGNSSVSQSVSHSVNESINKSTSKSVSSDSSLVQNLYNNFSHIKMSSPKKEGYDIPEFKPYIDKDAQKEKEPVLSNLLRGNRPGNSNGISSKVRAKFNIFLKRKNELEVEVRELMGSFSNEQVQPKTLKLKALDLKSRLTSLNIENWINDDKVCHLDPIELSNWEDRIGKDIATVLYQTEDKINIRKGLAQSGIKKGILPASMDQFWTSLC